MCFLLLRVLLELDEAEIHRVQIVGYITFNLVLPWVRAENSKVNSLLKSISSRLTPRIAIGVFQVNE